MTSKSFLSDFSLFIKKLLKKFIHIACRVVKILFRFMLRGIKLEDQQCEWETVVDFYHDSHSGFKTFSHSQTRTYDWGASELPVRLSLWRIGLWKKISFLIKCANKSRISTGLWSALCVEAVARFNNSLVANFSFNFITLQIRFGIKRFKCD